MAILTCNNLHEINCQNMWEKFRLPVDFRVVGWLSCWNDTIYNWSEPEPEEGFPKTVRYFLSILFLIIGLALFAGIVYWLMWNRDVPESTDLPQRRH
jgi:hypothetical protein